MAKITFNKLGLKAIEETVKVPVTDSITLEVTQYLPQAKKADFISFVVQNAMNYETGTFSPIRVETFVLLGIMKYYAKLEFTEKQLAEADKTYDVLQTNKIFDKVIAAIPTDEYTYITESIEKTITDICRYNTSFAGMITAMNSNATDLNDQINEIMESLKNKEGIETLDEIKNIVG